MQASLDKSLMKVSMTFSHSLAASRKQFLRSINYRGEGDIIDVVQGATNNSNTIILLT